MSCEIIWNMRIPKSDCSRKRKRNREKANTAGMTTTRFPTTEKKVILTEFQR